MARTSINTDPGEHRIETGAHRTVTRITTALEFVAASRDGVRLAAITEVLAAPKSSAYSLVRGLTAVGYLAEDAGVYRIGPAVTALLTRLSRRQLPEQLHPLLQQLSNTTGETALLGIRVGMNVVYLDQVESPERIRYAAPLNQRRELFHTSMGKVFLAHMQPRELVRILPSIPGRETTTDDEVLSDLQRVKGYGVGYNRNETVEGVTAAAAGVWSGNRLVCALSVAGPSHRMHGKLTEVGESVQAAAKRASELLGGEMQPQNDNLDLRQSANAASA